MLQAVKNGIGANNAKHGHAFTAEDRTAMMHFFDMHLRGKDPGRRFDVFPAQE